MAAMKAAFNVAIEEWQLIEKEATDIKYMATAREHISGLREGLEVALYVIKAGK